MSDPMVVGTGHADIRGTTDRVPRSGGRGKAQYSIRKAATPRPVESRLRLGKREEEVGRLVAQGLSNKETASRLFLSERTVETHVHNLLNKLGVNSRAQIAAWFASEAAVT